MASGFMVRNRQQKSLASTHPHFRCVLKLRNHYSQHRRRCARGTQPRSLEIPGLSVTDKSARGGNDTSNRDLWVHRGYDSMTLNLTLENFVTPMHVEVDKKRHFDSVLHLALCAKTDLG